MEKKTQENPRSLRRRVTSIDPREVFFEIVGRKDIELELMNLVWATRKVAGGKVDQTICGLVDGTIIYPLCERWDPPLDKPSQCLVYVLRGEKREARALAFDLAEERRQGRWRSVMSVTKEVTFRKGEDDDFYGFDKRGKKVIASKKAGVVITDEEIKNRTPVWVMTAERLRKHDAICRVSPEMVAQMQSAQDAVRGNAEKGLLVQAEAVGAVLAGADLFMLDFGGGVYDICSELGVHKSASLEEIDNAYELHCEDLHPDKREPRELIAYGVETVQDLPSSIQNSIQKDFGVLHACYRRLKLVRTREIAVVRFREKGRKAFNDIYGVVSVKAIAERVFKQPDDVLQRLKDIGFPVRSGDSMIGVDTAHTLLGSFVADVEEEQKEALLAPTKKSEPVTEVLVAEAPAAPIVVAQVAPAAEKPKRKSSRKGKEPQDSSATPDEQK